MSNPRQQIEADIARLNQQLADKMHQLEMNETQEAQQLEALMQEINNKWRPACDKGNVATIKLLLEKMAAVPDNASVQDFGSTLNLNDASDSYWPKVLFILYAMRAAIYHDNAEMLSVVLDAVMKWEWNQSYRELIDKSMSRPWVGNRPSFKNSPLIEAIEKNSAKCIPVLLQKGADPNAILWVNENMGPGRGDHCHIRGTALILTIQNKNTTISKQLIDRGAFYDDRYTAHMKNWKDPIANERFFGPIPTSDFFCRDFDFNLTPLKLAEQCKNQELVNYMQVGMKKRLGMGY